MQNTREKRAEIFWFLFGIIMIVAPTIWMVSQIRELFGGNIMEQKEFVFQAL